MAAAEQTIVTARVQHIPAYFNSVTYCRIPSRWTAEVVDGLPANVSAIYSDGLGSRDAAVNDLITQLKRFGVSGRLRLISA